MIESATNPLLETEQDVRAEGFSSLSANELASMQQGDEDDDDDDEYEEPFL